MYMCMYIYIYIYMYICAHTCVSLSIYIERERVRERENMYVSVYMSDISLSLYIYIYRERERNNCLNNMYTYIYIYIYICLLRHGGEGRVHVGRTLHLREMGGAPRNPAPRNHFLLGIAKPSGCHCTDALGGNKYRRVHTPLRSTSPFSGHQAEPWQSLQQRRVPRLTHDGDDALQHPGLKIYAG